MKYYNQLEYPYIPYETDTQTKDSRFHKLTVKEAGCGPCCLCMAVDELTTKNLPLEHCLNLSRVHGANLEVGTTMEILAPVVAQAFDLQLTLSNNLQEVKEALQKGAKVICNVGGDREGYIGVFSHCGHFILLVSCDEENFCILDPSAKEGKFSEEGRIGKVIQKGDFLYCAHDIVHKDVENRNPGYYIFARR